MPRLSSARRAPWRWGALSAGFHSDNMAQTPRQRCLVLQRDQLTACPEQRLRSQPENTGARSPERLPAACAGRAGGGCLHPKYTRTASQQELRLLFSPHGKVPRRKIPLISTPHLTLASFSAIPLMLIQSGGGIRKTNSSWQDAEKISCQNPTAPMTSAEDAHPECARRGVRVSAETDTIIYI